MKIQEPWNGLLGKATGATLFLILTNTTLVLVLATITALATGFQAGVGDSTSFVQQHSLLLRAELVFFWCTTPLVMLIASIIENFCFWTDRLRPLYVVVASVLAIGMWVMQFSLWRVCIDAPGSTAPGYCPYTFNLEKMGHNTVSLQRVGSPDMATLVVPSLGFL